LRNLLEGHRYYWATNQAEYSTKLMFKSRLDLRGLYPRSLDVNMLDQAY